MQKTSSDDITVLVPCEVYSRIVGYMRPVQSWHRAKQQEFRDRKTFDRAVSKLEDRNGELAEKR